MLHELYEEETGYEDADVAQEPPELDPENIPALRGLLIELQKLDKREEQVTRTRNAVVESYNAQLSSIESRRQWLRSALQAFLERHGEPTKSGGRKVSFPDVGTAYLAKGDPRAEVADREALKEELGAMFTKQTFDETAAKNYALELALDGKPIPPGVNIVPGGPRLQIRKA